jgi:outer membrane protein
MFQKHFFLIAVLLALPALLPAQTVFSSLEEVWRYADAHNVTIRTALYEADKSGYTKKQAYSALLPQVNATGAYTDNIALQTTLIPAEVFGGPPGSFRTLQFGQQFVYTGGITAQMNVLNLQNWYNAKIARQTEELSKDSLANARKTVYQQIATQYYSYLLMREAYLLANQTAAIADSVYQSANNKFNEGVINEANLDVAKLNLERAQQTQITAQYQVLIAKNNIKALLGIKLRDSLTFIASLKGSIDIAMSGVFEEDPAIRLALNKTRISLNQYKMANSAFAPTINVLYSYATQRFDNKFEPFSGFNGVAGWFPAQYWSLQASFPLFTSGSRWFQSRKGKINYNESLMQYEHTQNQLAINDENIRLNYGKAVAVLSKAENVMKLSLDNYTHITYRYEAGLSSLDERLNAFTDFISYQNQYLNSLSDMLVQLYQVKIRQQSF